MLATPAADIAPKEITKQVAFLATGLADVQFVDPSTLEFNFDGDQAGDRPANAGHVAERVRRSLRRLLQRKVAYRSRAMEAQEVHRAQR